MSIVYVSLRAGYTIGHAMMAAITSRVAHVDASSLYSLMEHFADIGFDGYWHFADVYFILGILMLVAFH